MLGNCKCLPWGTQVSPWSYRGWQKPLLSRSGPGGSTVGRTCNNFETEIISNKKILQQFQFRFSQEVIEAI